MKNFSRALVFVGLVLSLASVSTARAEIYANALIGLAALPEKSGLDSRVGYGFDLGYKPIAEVGVGGYYLSSTGDFPGTNLNAQLEFYGGEVTFYLPLTGFSAGVRVGSNLLSPGYPGSASSSNTLAWGPKIGWDTSLVFLPVSVGIEYNPMFVAGSGRAVGSFTVQNLNAVIGARF